MEGAIEEDSFTVRWAWPPDRSLSEAQVRKLIAEMGERAGRVFTLENLNTAVDHPGVPFAKAADTLALIQAVDNPHLRLNLDFAHEREPGHGQRLSRFQIAALFRKLHEVIGVINYFSNFFHAHG